MYDMAGKDGEKLAIGIKEEDIPTEILTKIPVIGRLIKASNVSYEAAAKTMRVKLADDAYEIARKAGDYLSDPEVVGGINKVINMITGRANLGIFERASGDINIAIFAVKLFKSNIRFITTLPKVGYKSLAGKTISASFAVSVIN